jgi:segregation and condensation protein B
MDDRQQDDIVTTEPIADTPIEQPSAGITPQEMLTIVESILFVNEKPISSGEIAHALAFEEKPVEDAICALRDAYAARHAGICIIAVAGGWQMRTADKNSEWVRLLYKSRFKRKLSMSALEVLSIIAYKQPITKLEIEAIRGVDCDGVIRTLLAMGLVKFRGRKDIIGRPFLYGTSNDFLEHFGLNSVDDMPKLADDMQLSEEFRKLVEKSNIAVTADDIEPEQQHTLMQEEGHEEDAHGSSDAA